MLLLLSLIVQDVHAACSKGNSYNSRNYIFRVVPIKANKMGRYGRLERGQAVCREDGKFYEAEADHRLLLRLDL